MSEHPLWFAGNRQPSITETITSDGAVVNLSGSTVRFKAREFNSSSLIVDQPAVFVTDGSDGRVRYDWSASDIAANGILNDPGKFLVWWEVTTGGKTQDMNEAIIEVRAHASETGAYVELEEFKSTTELSGESYADSDIQNALVAASRGLDAALGQRFYLDADVNQVRYYTAELADHIRIDPLVTLTSLASDPGDDGTFEETWTVNSDFVLEPVNALADGKPFDTARILSAGRYAWPGYPSRIKVTGRFGWPAVPAAVKQLTTIVAARLVRRTREAPFGIIQMGIEGSAVHAASIARDPEFAFLAAGLSKKRLLV